MQSHRQLQEQVCKDRKRDAALTITGDLDSARHHPQGRSEHEPLVTQLPVGAAGPAHRLVQ